MEKLFLTLFMFIFSCMVGAQSRPGAGGGEHGYVPPEKIIVSFINQLNANIDHCAPEYKKVYNFEQAYFFLFNLSIGFQLNKFDELIQKIPVALCEPKSKFKSQTFECILNDYELKRTIEFMIEQPDLPFYLRKNYKLSREEVFMRIEFLRQISKSNLNK